MRSREEALCVHQLRKIAFKVDVLSGLSELIYLDVSDDNEERIPVDSVVTGSRFSVRSLLQNKNILPNLRYLDISGIAQVNCGFFNFFGSAVHSFVRCLVARTAS